MSITEPVVRTDKGFVKGKHSRTDDGFTFYSFLGIPYAKPPIEDLRFKAPQPADAWDGVKDATEFGNISMQPNFFLNKISGDEDCLFINVYTPKLPVDGGKDIAVMVYIHGGGFVVGSGDADMAGPDYLIQNEVILVTLNYRLGALGFLSLENENISGNAGLKDQVAALHWVQDNIRSFGGNANNVTIFGISAGAASVHYLLLSEKAKGLFHKAIAQSGTSLSPWAIQQNPKEKALKLCKAMGHTTEDVDDAYTFLKAASAKDLIEGHHKIANKKQTFDLDFEFVPCIENKYSEEEAFITEEPLSLLLEGKFHQIPFITGFTSAEGLFMIQKVLNKTINYEDLNSDFEYIIPSNIPKEKSEEIWEKIKTFYFNNEPISEKNVIQLVQLKGDTEFVYGNNKVIELQSKVSKHPIYCYQFSFEEMGFVKMMVQTDLPGACHGDDGGFLFNLNMVNMPIEKYSKADITRQRMTKLWTNFAKTGNPTPCVDELIPVVWQPVTKDALNYLDINADLTMQTNPAANRVSFIDGLYNNV